MIMFRVNPEKPESSILLFELKSSTTENILFIYDILQFGQQLDSGSGPGLGGLL